jgi:hypothetical protein
VVGHFAVVLGFLELRLSAGHWYEFWSGVFRFGYWAYLCPYVKVLGFVSLSPGFGSSGFGPGSSLWVWS